MQGQKMFNMNLLILLLLSPAAILAQQYRKSSNPNDEPFLPIHPDYSYNPKLLKRGIDQQQQQLLQQQHQQQSLAHVTPELYVPKVDARDSYSASYSQTPYYPTYETYAKATSTQNLASSPFYQSSFSSSSPYSLLNSYSAPYGSTTSGYAAGSPYAGLVHPSLGPTPYVGATPPALGGSPYASPGPGASGYPYYFYQPPYYYPNYYNQPPYSPPPPANHGGSPKNNRGEDEDEENEKRREKNQKYNGNKNKLRSSDRDAANSQFVDGGNYIIASSNDLDGESSSHRTPSHYNQIEDSEIQTRTVSLPKHTYRLVSISGQQPTDYSGPPGYIKVQQLEQLMRQALAKLLAQNAAQQVSLAKIQQQASQLQENQDEQQQYISVPNTIAKTGLSYVVNPTILTRVTPGQYNPSQLVQTPTPSSGKQTYSQKSATSVSLQPSPGIYVPPSKTDQSSVRDYGDYDAPEPSSIRSQQNSANYQASIEPTRHNYSYSTYRPTQQTNLEDDSFGSKQKTKN